MSPLICSSQILFVSSPSGDIQARRRSWSSILAGFKALFSPSWRPLLLWGAFSQFWKWGQPRRASEQLGSPGSLAWDYTQRRLLPATGSVPGSRWGVRTLLQGTRKWEVHKAGSVLDFVIFNQSWFQLLEEGTIISSYSWGNWGLGRVPLSQGRIACKWASWDLNTDSMSESCSFSYSGPTCHLVSIWGGRMARGSL